MICRMCLLDSTECIKIFDLEGLELNIAQIITKHFWFEPKIDDPISNIICYACWWKIESFHIYYTNVEEAHRNLTERFSVKSEPSASQTIVYSFKNDIDEKQFKKEESLGEEIQLLSEDNDDEGNEDCLSVQSAEVEYVDLGPITKEMHQSIKEIEELPQETSQIEKLCDVKEEVAQNTEVKRITRQSKNKCIQEKEQSKKNTAENKCDPFEKRKKRGRPRKLPFANSDKNQEEKDNISSSKKKTLDTNKKDKTEKESEYLKKSKEDDEKIANFMKLKCELCAAECRTFADVKKHYRVVHKRKGYVICCNKKLYKRILILDHINKHLNPDYFKCNICKKRFSDKQCLKNHMIRHESEDVKLYKCDQCPRRYAKQYLLDNHKLIHIPHNQREFICGDCGKAFPTNNLLQTHVRYVHENAYGKMCHICAKVIRGKTMFEKHQLEHAGIVEPKVQCKKCGAWLKHQYSLKKHMVRHAEERYTHACSICGKVAPSKGALRSHIQYVHASKRTYQCSVCDKAFKKPITLREHMTTHTGEVLYTCLHCPKTFNSSANMHSHRKKVHRKEWEESRRNRGIPQSDFKNNIEKQGGDDNNDDDEDGNEENEHLTVFFICDEMDEDGAQAQEKNNSLYKNKDICDSNIDN